MTVNGILYAFSRYVGENFLSLIGIVGNQNNLALAAQLCSIFNFNLF